MGWYGCIHFHRAGHTWAKLKFGEDDGKSNYWWGGCEQGPDNAIFDSASTLLVPNIGKDF